ncbi:hypothetical protein TrispH2_011940 [Trichoplax sp. H2]|nr:hypothetical protein TrispH2_011940 [Trichoplax sp. H2]|eukprot:RDD35993.1 hypothetical protein TrispH2_011940 [Trichoplax sp. H2]
MGFFALANSLFVVKLSQFSSTSPSQASGIVTFGVICIVSCPTYCHNPHLWQRKLLSNGVIGIISYQKNVAELDAWYKEIATITSGVCITSILFVLQTLTYINNNKKDLLWKDNQFAILYLLYTAIAIIGLIVALIGAKASRYPSDIFNHSIRYSPRSDSNNICMLASALLAGGIGISSLGLLNQEIWGFSTLFIAVTIC